MTKIKLLLTIFYALFAYSCTEQTIYSGKTINQANIDYSIIKDKNQLINELGNPSYIDPIESKYFYYSEKKIYKNFFDKKTINRIIGLQISDVPNFARCNYWLNILEINKLLSKKKLLKIINYLRKNGIETKPIWHPNHLQKKYKNCQTYKLNNINKIYLNRLCLPSSPQLTKSQQDFICKKLKNFF